MLSAALAFINSSSFETKLATEMLTILKYITSNRNHYNMVHHNNCYEKLSLAIIQLLTETAHKDWLIVVIISGIARLWSQGGHMGSPSGVQEQTPMGLGQSPQKPGIHREFAAVKCFSTQVCCRVCPPSPLTSTQKELFRSARIPWPNTAGAWCTPWADVHLCPPWLIPGNSSRCQQQSL